MIAFGRPSRNSIGNNLQPGNVGCDRHSYYTQRLPLGRITLPPISPMSLMQNLLFTVQKSVVPLQQRSRRRRTFPTDSSNNEDTDDDLMSDHNYVMATSAISDSEENVDVATSSTLPPTASSTNLVDNDDDDNSDIFYRNDDDYLESLTSSKHVYYNSISSSDSQKIRRRTSWWTTDNDGNENDHSMSQNFGGAHHPSLQTIQPVIRIKVQKTSKMEHDKAATSSNDEELQRYIESLTQPLLTETVWNQLTGTEWCGRTGSSNDEQNIYLHGQLLDSLAEMGESVARIDAPTKWINWQVYSTSSGSSGSSSNPNDDVQVWTGKCIATPPPMTKSDADDDDHHPHSSDVAEEKYLGIQLPFIKTRAILPYSVTDVVDLLLDSKKVVTYNPWSLGRKDCWIDTTTDTTSTKLSMTTKIVQNRVQPPIPGARQVVSTTLLHARPIQSTADSSDLKTDPNAMSWIIVSRSVGKNHIYNDESDQKTRTSRSDILLGVNLLEPIRSPDGTMIDTNQCRITAVTHVYSPSVPTAFAERLGVQSSIKFIQDIRNLKHKSSHHTDATLTTETTQETVNEPTNVHKKQKMDLIDTTERTHTIAVPHLIN